MGGVCCCIEACSHCFGELRFLEGLPNAYVNGAIYLLLPARKLVDDPLRPVSSYKELLAGNRTGAFQRPLRSGSLSTGAGEVC